MSTTNAAEIMRTVIEDGQSELERASLGLAFSGFVAGLCVPFGAVARRAGRSRGPPERTPPRRQRADAHRLGPGLQAAAPQDRGRAGDEDR